MFSKDNLMLLSSLGHEYTVIVSNGHDIHLLSHLTGHEWIVVSPYNRSSCEILHRHDSRNEFHHQKGQYSSLKKALEYIVQHDNWFYSHSHNKVK